LPASARDYSRHHHHWRHGVYSHHQFVRVYTGDRFGTDGETWGDRAPARRFADVGAPQGRYQDQSRYQEFAGRQNAWARSERAGRFGARDTGHGELDAMIARHAQSEGVPEALVHRVVIRESRYRPGVVGSGGAMGLMQIKYSTARAMGYTGSPSGLLDPETNLTYAVRYLAGAYRVAGGNSDRAVSNYARGYYDAAKRQGVSPYATTERSGDWSRSYASAQPIERVADAGPVVLRPYRYARHRVH
jgi:soluble lytic murein transglycosylase-like protein